jgi:hypothetical protein
MPPVRPSSSYGPGSIHFAGPLVHGHPTERHRPSDCLRCPRNDCFDRRSRANTNKTMQGHRRLSARKFSFPPTLGLDFGRFVLHEAPSRSRNTLPFLIQKRPTCLSPSFFTRVGGASGPMVTGGRNGRCAHSWLSRANSVSAVECIGRWKEWSW